MINLAVNPPVDPRKTAVTKDLLQPEERADVMKHLQICKPCLERFSFEEGLVVSIRQKMVKLCAPSALKARLSSLINRQP